MLWEWKAECCIHYSFRQKLETPRQYKGTQSLDRLIGAIRYTQVSPVEVPMTTIQDQMTEEGQVFLRAPRVQKTVFWMGLRSQEN